MLLYSKHDIEALCLFLSGLLFLDFLNTERKEATRMLYPSFLYRLLLADPRILCVVVLSFASL